MARRDLTGALLVGGASNRFGSPKALARLGEETLAECGWRTLGEICGERIAVGKAGDKIELPFPVVDDATDVRASIAGVVDALRALVRACGGDVDAAVPQTGPLPGVYRKRTLPVFETALEAGRLALREVLESLRVAVVELDPALLANINSPEELQGLR